MLIIFRADASLQIGTGHIMRCLTLADALRERGARCCFVCRPHQGHLLPLITRRGHRALSLPRLQEGYQHNYSHNCTAHAHWLGTEWNTDAKDTQQALSALTVVEPVDWLVVDHYALDVCWEQALRPHAKRIMVIDDLADRRHDCDLLLDQNLGRSLQDYNGLLKDKTAALIGPQYALLRHEFAAFRAQSLTRRERGPDLRRLLISMGGVDKDNATSQVLSVLQGCTLPADFSATVVMGQHAPWLAQVEAQAAQMPWPTEVLVSVDNMAQLMADSDLAIGAAGGTAWERCCIGLPSLVFALANNQLSSAFALQKAGAAVVIESHRQLSSFMAPLQEREMAKKVLTKLSKAASLITDGQGCQRTVKYMFEAAHG